MRVADIDAVEVFFKPRHESRWPVRAWIDKKTSLVVKCQKLDAQGAVLEQVAFTQFSLTTKTNGANPGGGANSTGAPTTGGLTSSFMGVKDWKVRDASMVALAPAPSLKYKPETLKGFEIVGVYQRAAKTDQAPFSIRRYVLSDGIATVSVFVQSRSVAGPLTERVRRNGALTMLSREIQEAWVTVMGDVPPETLRQFAQTIEWKSTP
jgi:sigma-E factor negative regulatory protein RseB